MYHRLRQVYKDRNIVRQLVKRAEMAGFKAIALTVDTPILGRREADIKNRCWSNNWWTEPSVCSTDATLIVSTRSLQTVYVLWNHVDSPYLHIWCWKTLKLWILARWTRLSENWAWHRLQICIYFFRSYQIFCDVSDKWFWACILCCWSSWPHPFLEGIVCTL